MYVICFNFWQPYSQENWHRDSFEREFRAPPLKHLRPCHRIPDERRTAIESDIAAAIPTFDNRAPLRNCIRHFARRGGVFMHRGAGGESARTCFSAGNAAAICRATCPAGRLSHLVGFSVALGLIKKDASEKRISCMCNAFSARACAETPVWHRCMQLRVRLFPTRMPNLPSRSRADVRAVATAGEPTRSCTLVTSSARSKTR